jgi:hypothetical protein
MKIALKFIATAIAEKMATIKTYDYLEERAKKASMEEFQKIMSKVSDKNPVLNEDVIF